MSKLALNNWNLSFWILDFDGNILKTSTNNYFLNKKTWKIEEVEAHYVDQNPEIFYWKGSNYRVISDTFSEFRDVYHNPLHRWFDGMIKDVEEAIKNNNFAPSFEVFKDMYLLNARVFAILTARWNSPDNFQKAFTIINESVLTKEEKEQQFENIIKNYNLETNISREDALYHYLWEITNYITCYNPQLEKILWFQDLSWRERKAKAIDFLLNYYVNLLEKLNSKKVSEILNSKNSLSFWFSDDSVGNIVAVYHKFQQILRWKDFYPELSKKFSVYFTWKPESYHDLVKQLWKRSGFKEEIRDYWLKIKLKK